MRSSVVHTWWGRCGAVLLVASLLGWSAWWAVCNVYEFAPRLPTWPLVAAGCLTVAGLLPVWRKAGTPGWLAAANAAFLLVLHRGWSQPDVAGGIWLAATLALLWRGARVRPRLQTQAAGKTPAA